MESSRNLKDKNGVENFHINIDLDEFAEIFPFSLRGAFSSAANQTITISCVPRIPTNVHTRYPHFARPAVHRLFSTHESPLRMRAHLSLSPATRIGTAADRTSVR